MQNEQIAEHRAEHEQEHTHGERGNEPLALVGLQGRQEERENLPQNNRHACDNRRPQRNLETNRERAKHVEHVQNHQAIVALGQVISYGQAHELNDGRRCHIEHAHGNK